MTYVRRGKCTVCKTPATETRDFVSQVSLLDPSPASDNVIKPELAQQLQSWRDAPIYCDDHLTERSD